MSQRSSAVKQLVLNLADVGNCCEQRQSDTQSAPVVSGQQAANAFQQEWLKCDNSLGILQSPHKH